MSTPLVQPPTGSPAIDLDLALSRVGGDEELLKEIAKLFLDDYPRALADLRAAAAASDARGVERAAHGLKGSVSHFGARVAVETASNLEQLGRSQQLAGIDGLLDQLERALAALRPELEAI
jgi:two-component system sensor histidine kinase/response regulator